MGENCLQLSTVDRSHFSDYARCSRLTEIQLVGLRRSLVRSLSNPGHVDDRRPVKKLVRQLWGKLFGDRGYLSQELFEQLWAQGLPLITKLKRTMKNKLRPLFDKLLLRQRALIEGVNDQWKNSSQVE